MLRWTVKKMPTHTKGFQREIVFEGCNNYRARDGAKHTISSTTTSDYIHLDVMHQLARDNEQCIIDNAYLLLASANPMLFQNF